MQSAKQENRNKSSLGNQVIMVTEFLIQKFNLVIEKMIKKNNCSYGGPQQSGHPWVKVSVERNI